MSNITRISFIRHGHVHNPEQVIYGRLPGFGLSDLGRQQVQATAEFLSKQPLVAVFSSPLLRARQTAEMLLPYHNSIPLSIADAINEVAFYFEGAPMHEMAARNWDLYSGVPETYEQPPDVVRRVRAFLNLVRRDYAGQHVALVSHGDVIAFTILWAHNVALIPANKHTLDQLGLRDNYPAPASITTFAYKGTEHKEQPDGVDYDRPYGDELLDKGTSPK